MHAGTKDSAAAAAAAGREYDPWLVFAYFNEPPDVRRRFGLNSQRARYGPGSSSSSSSSGSR